MTKKRYITEDSGFRIQDSAEFRILNPESQKGFTLVELIVSMTIAAIMMVGISAFFSSSFRNILVAQNQSAALERQGVVNEIIKDKFATLDSLVEFSSNKILIFNKNTKDQLPFSYIGMDSNKNLVFKDLLVFNKIGIDPYTTPPIHLYANSGNGSINVASSGSSPSPSLTPTTNFKNFSSFEKLLDKNGKTHYFIVLPNENKVQDCNCGSSPCSCEDLNTSQLDSPTDIAIGENGKFLFISDSGNGRVIKYDIDKKEELASPLSPLATGLKYPTGLAYYKKGSEEYLFIADTLDNKIRKVDANNPLKLPVVVGDGDDATCSNTAKFCKLNMPTGLYADSTNHALYIADSGNNRILKMSDPGTPDKITLSFKPGKNYALDRIEFTNSSWSGGTYVAKATNRLIGTSSNFDFTSNPKTFSNSDRLTAFTNDECNSSTNTVYTNEEFLSTNYNLKKDDTIIINKAPYIIDSLMDTASCEKTGDPSLPKGKITLKGPSYPSVSLGDTIYFANPDTVDIEIDKPTITNSGNFSFQTFTIKTYDIFDGLVSTDYHVERVGDGKLGTEEDKIEIVASGGNINFPTGVTDLYYANSNQTGNAEVKRLTGPPNAQSLNAISTSSFKNFDYVSEFKLADTDPIKFTQYNNKSILELTLNAVVDENTIQKYVLNANIPNP